MRLAEQTIALRTKSMNPNDPNGGVSTDRRRLLITSELVLAVASLILVLNSLLAHPSLGVIFVVSALMSAVNGFHRPALDEQHRLRAPAERLEPECPDPA